MFHTAPWNLCENFVEAERKREISSGISHISLIHIFIYSQSEYIEHSSIMCDVRNNILCQFRFPSLAFRTQKFDDGRRLNEIICSKKTNAYRGRWNENECKNLYNFALSKATHICGWIWLSEWIIWILVSAPQSVSMQFECTYQTTQNYFGNVDRGLRIWSNRVSESECWEFLQSFNWIFDGRIFIPFCLWFAGRPPIKFYLHFSPISYIFEMVHLSFRAYIRQINKIAATE